MLAAPAHSTRSDTQSAFHNSIPTRCQTASEPTASLDECQPTGIDPTSAARGAIPSTNTNTGASTCASQPASHLSMLEQTPSSVPGRATRPPGDLDQGWLSTVLVRNDAKTTASPASKTSSTSIPVNPTQSSPTSFRAIRPSQSIEKPLQYHNILHPVPPGVEHPATKEKRMSLLHLVNPVPHHFPHLEWYVSNRAYENILSYDIHPPQSFRPPHHMPDHAVFVYYGRNLSNPMFPLPRLRDGRALFDRSTSGDRTDRGFGPGVMVSNEIRAEVAQVEQKEIESLIYYDVQRSQAPT